MNSQIELSSIPSGVLHSFCWSLKDEKARLEKEPAALESSPDATAHIRVLAAVSETLTRVEDVLAHRKALI